MHQQKRAGSEGSPARKVENDAGRPPKFPRWGGRSLAARKQQEPSSYSDMPLSTAALPRNKLRTLAAVVSDIPRSKFNWRPGCSKLRLLQVMRRCKPASKVVEMMPARAAFVSVAQLSPASPDLSISNVLALSLGCQPAVHSQRLVRSVLYVLPLKKCSALLK